MSGSDRPPAPPPEVPEEFAAAYRDAYERALQRGDAPDHRRTDALAPAGVAAAVLRWRHNRWLAGSSLLVAALALVLLAYALGRAFATDAPTDARGGTAAQSARSSGPARSQSPPGSFAGPVRPVTIDGISADCTAPPSTDAAGHRVTYAADNAIDDKATTAWRCPGTAVGQKLTLQLAGMTAVGEVGLVPGYAKTDPVSGADRYAENNRITRVRWTLADGVSLVQRLDPDASSRRLQTIRVPRTRTDHLTLEILAVQRGPRDTTAISEISVAAAS